MNRTKALLLLSIFGLSVILTACCGGGSTKVVSQPNNTTTTTLGQELTDLEKAHEQGILTDKEYEKAKERIIKERTGG